MKKILVSVLLAVCLVCAGLAVACAPKYCVLNFERIQGIEYVSEVVDGAEVKKGYTVDFKLVIDENKVNISGDAPEVRANGAVLTCDADGVYKYKVNSNTLITVSNATAKYTIEFDTTVNVMDDSNNVGESIENGVYYYSDDVDVNKVTVLENGTQVKFTLRPSVYCAPVNPQEGIIVLADTTIIWPDDNGVYTVEVTGNVKIQVRGLQQDTAFTLRDDGGEGTAANPFKISKPIDLYYLAAYVNTDSFSSSIDFRGAYYEMTDDLDLKGEQLYIIGDLVATQSAFFYGDFNGNGYTISNYHIKDYVIDQEVYMNVFTPYIGVFGFAGAAVGARAANIYNLNVENFEISADVTSATIIGGRDDKNDKSFAVGGIVGYSVGATLTGCSASGKIEVTAAADSPAFAGGLVGYQTAAADTSVRYYSAVRSCSSAVNITGYSGRIYAAGGITGYLASLNRGTSSFILNSYNTGEVRGAMNVGGIVGILGANSSVGNCYNTGYVSATSRETLVMGNNEQFAYAYAGGIAGFMDSDTIVYNCFGAGETPFAYSVNGDKYAAADGIAAFKAEGGEFYVETQKAVLMNNEVKGDGVYNKAFFIGNLKWNEVDWKFGEGEYPVINHSSEETHFSYNIVFDLKGNEIDGSTRVTVNAEDVYLPMSLWNLQQDGFAEFLDADNGLRSYGYYFDPELTDKVPYGYVPVKDITLYVGFADYSGVVGTYYLQLDDNNGVNIELKANGDLVYRNGALIFTSYYTFDGEHVTLFDCPAFAVVMNNSVTYLAGKATVTDGVMNAINATVAGDGVYSSDNPLIAVRTVSGFTYGTYYAGDASYTFYENGKGVTSAGVEFDYTVSGNTLTTSNNLTVVLSGGKVVSVNGVTVTLIDGFVGTWETAAGSNKQYTFDGKGNWSYEHFGYDANGNKTVTDGSAESGTYTVSGGKITFTHGGKNYTGSFDANGMLVLGDGTYTQTYYKENSFSGRWKFFNTKDLEPIELVLDGISKDGYGYATAIYRSAEYVLTYEALVYDNATTLVFYDADFIFARLIFNAAEGTLSGSIYSDNFGVMYDADTLDALYPSEDYSHTVYPELENPAITFCLYDEFNGVWISEQTGMELVQFNGFGSYDLNGNLLHTSVKGVVTINGITAGSYTLENHTLSGSFVYHGVEYAISYNEQTGKIDITNKDTGDDFMLEERDGWHALELADESGNVYKFDGRGQLASGGKMTVTDADGVKTVYTYKVNSSGLSISGDATGSITNGSDGLWDLSLGGSKKLFVNNGFEGRWLIGDNNGVERIMTIGKTGHTLTATGTVEDTYVTFKYNTDGLMEFEYNNVKYYLRCTGTELQLGLDKSLSVASHCIPVSLKDNYIGVYNAADGKKITMDGLGNTEYADGGTAMLFDKDGSPLNKFVYNFVGDTIVFTDTEITVVNGVKKKLVYCFILSADGEYVSKWGERYDLKEVDKFYGRYVVDGKNSEIKYTFDGFGKITSTTGVVYTYDIEKIEEKNNSYIFVLTDAQGKKYEGVYVFVEYSNTLLQNVYSLTITAKNA